MIVKGILISLVSLFSTCFLEYSEFSESQKLVGNQEASELAAVDSTNSGLVFLTQNSYRSEKESVRKVRQSIQKHYLLVKNPVNDARFLDSVSNIFTDLLLNNIVPHWYGTPWDFDGYTSIPNKGKIACGYFVSTTLNHMGLNLNRYHLARQGPLNEAKSIAVDDNFVFTFSSDRYSIQNKFFKSFIDGLYFVGLDSHVGYLYIYNGEAYFLHSNYIKNRVMIESVENSEAFKSYNYNIVRITGNKLLMKKWILGSRIDVYKG